jgi:hypothetical protein
MMEWFKLSTKLPRDPKWRALSPQAKVLYIEWACEIAEQETDGVYHLAGRAPRGTAELLAKGLILSHDEGYYLPAFLKWNTTREEMEQRRISKRQAGAKGGRISKRKARASTADKAEVELEVEKESENQDLASLREAPKARTPSVLGEALLAPDSRAQYLHGRLVQADERWRKVNPAALVKFGKEYGADLVITALSFCYEEGASPLEPYPYLQAVCERIRTERETG